MTAGSGNGRKQRLELTWIGKDERPRLEPRILLPVDEYSFRKGKGTDGGIHDNILIHGDNLLALKSLEQRFAGKVQCIYIDPPFNTQQAFETYDDGLEHSSWLTLMRDRIQMLHRLLDDSGSFFVHIDDNELGYLMALTDEIFGRRNRVALITFKQSSVSGPKAINPGVVTTGNYIVLYCKDKEKWKNFKVYQRTERDDRYSKYIQNKEDDYGSWRLIALREAFCKHHKLTWEEARGKFAEKLEQRIEQFVLTNSEQVVRTARVAPHDVNEEARSALQQSLNQRNKVFRSERADRGDYYFLNGEQLLFYRTKVRTEGDSTFTAVPASNIWDDLLSNNLHAEGGVSFPNGKKPELLLKRIIEMSTELGDIVLDSFAGSGTTGAVAHKMGRRWIMVELGEHATTHIAPRMKRVVSGEDATGATASAGWKGGGGFRTYRLAPSLIESDQFGQKIISKHYDAEMLAEAMCKHMGFTYIEKQAPDEYWKHGFSSERDFIYVTTQSLTHDALKALSLEVGEERSLLVCCKAFRARLSDFPNLTIKKIPQAVLANCEWGRDDYSLNIAKPPEDAADDPGDGGPDSDDGNGGEPEPRRRGGTRRRTELESDLRAAPVRKAPLKMDGTTRPPKSTRAAAHASPRVAAGAASPKRAPAATKAPKAAAKESKSNKPKPAPKARINGKPALVKATTKAASKAKTNSKAKSAAPKLKPTSRAGARRSGDDRQGRLL